MFSRRYWFLELTVIACYPIVDADAAVTEVGLARVSTWTPCTHMFSRIDKTSVMCIIILVNIRVMMICIVDNRSAAPVQNSSSHTVCLQETNTLTPTRQRKRVHTPVQCDTVSCICPLWAAANTTAQAIIRYVLRYWDPAQNTKASELYLTC